GRAGRGHGELAASERGVGQRDEAPGERERRPDRERGEREEPGEERERRHPGEPWVPPATDERPRRRDERARGGEEPADHPEAERAEVLLDEDRSLEVRSLEAEEPHHPDELDHVGEGEADEEGDEPHAEEGEQAPERSRTPGGR